MRAHVDPDTKGLMEVGHHVHTREAHCVASGCDFEGQTPERKAELVQLATDWKQRYGGTNVAVRAGDIRARRQLQSRVLNQSQFGE